MTPSVSLSLDSSLKEGALGGQSSQTLRFGKALRYHFKPTHPPF